MLKNILSLDGVQSLTRNEQKAIAGGITDTGKAPVPPGLICCEYIYMCGSQICIREDVVCETTSEM